MEKNTAQSEMEYHHFIHKVLLSFYDNSTLFWKTENGIVQFYVNCSDVFAWGCADASPLTPENWNIFEQCLQETNGDCDMAAYLFSARLSHMRPQGAFYKYIPENLYDLFDACGPEREVGLGNPIREEDAKREK